MRPDLAARTVHFPRDSGDLPYIRPDMYRTPFAATGCHSGGSHVHIWGDIMHGALGKMPVGLTAAASMLLFAGCSASEPATADELTSALESIRVNDQPLNVQTASDEDASQWMEESDQGAGSEVTPSECAETVAADPSRIYAAGGEFVGGATTEAPIMVVMAFPDAADRVDLAERPECATFQVDNMTITQIDASTDADATYAFSSTIVGPDSSGPRDTILTSTYRDAVVMVIGTESSGAEAPPIADYEKVMNDLAAALG